MPISSSPCWRTMRRWPRWPARRRRSPPPRYLPGGIPMSPWERTGSASSARSTPPAPPGRPGPGGGAGAGPAGTKAASGQARHRGGGASGGGRALRGAVCGDRAARVRRRHRPGRRGCGRRSATISSSAAPSRRWAKAFSLVRKYGVDPALMHEVMTEGLFGAPAYKTYGRIIVDQAYDPARAESGARAQGRQSGAGGGRGGRRAAAERQRVARPPGRRRGPRRRRLRLGRHGTRTGPRQRACVVFAGNSCRKFCPVEICAAEAHLVARRKPPAPPPGSLSPADRNFRR